MKNRTLIVCVLLLLITACSAAPQPGKIEVSDASVRMLGGEMEAAGYLVIKNNSSTADRLLGITSDAAQQLMLHQSSVDANGVASMKMVMSIDVPAGGQVELKPGGYHIVISGLKPGLKAGDVVTFQLQFEHAGTVSVQAQVINQ